MSLGILDSAFLESGMNCLSKTHLKCFWCKKLMYVVSWKSWHQDAAEKFSQSRERALLVYLAGESIKHFIASVMSMEY